MVDEVTPEDVKAKLDAGDGCQIIDIRDPEEFAEGHIPGAVNIPMADLPRELGSREWGDDIVAVCPMGVSSVQAARLLQSYEGVSDDARVTSMEGGYQEWEYELETE